MRSKTWASAFISFAAMALLAGRARAQSETGFGLDRFNPSERGSDWFSEDSLDLRGDLRAAFGVVGEFAIRPLALYNDDGSIRAIPVHYQLILHPGGSLVLFDRLRIGVDVPIAAYNKGDTGTAGGVTYPGQDAGGIGDVRVSADVRLLGSYGDVFTLAAGAQVFIPTGDQDKDLGDGKARLIIPRVLAAGDIGPIAYAAHVGFEYRALDDAFAGTSLGSEIVFGVSAGVRALDRKLLLGPELYGSTVVTSGDSAFSKKTTPLELMLGGHYLIGSDVRVGLGVAPGLTRGFGEPAVRYVAAIEWAPEPAAEPADRDHDGILDADDACPDEAGVKTDDPKTNGCPPEAPPEPADRDKDGVLDADDACPDVAGIKTDDPKTNGCPPDPDRDKDGIPNDVDACPDAPGPKNADPKKNGCPAAAVVGKQIVIREQVKFATGSAVILPASNDILSAVIGVLDAHPEITHVRIEGHTDNVGGAAMNQTLSDKRAASVVAWLVKHGTQPGRLSSQGFGLDRPIDTNETPEGRQNNRRVEFHIDSDEATK
jgi:outer membrane protein OmpA-like peptidoglycan-associated protein